MKLGTENRTTTIVASVLFLVAIFLLARMWSGGGRPAAAATPTTTQAAAAAAPQSPRGRRARGHTPGGHDTTTLAPLDPRLRLDLLTRSEHTDYTGTGRNIFLAEAEIPKPIESPIKKAENTPPPPPPGPPPPPPINLKFFGLASRKGEPTKIFLGTGEDVFVAGEGDIVNRRYKIVKINPNSVDIEDVLSNHRQTIPLTAP
ncbi:MAG: hypothetical protein LAN64_08130 [Acidobacteriia bacterium]|nr:hypothetical protein [Terriglobia bacterium]